MTSTNPSLAVPLDERDREIIRLNLSQWLTGPPHSLDPDAIEAELATPLTVTCHQNTERGLLVVRAQLPTLGWCETSIHPAVDYRVMKGDPRPIAPRFTWPWHQAPA